MCGPGRSGGDGADDPLAPLRVLGHETGLREHGDVLLHRREAHGVVGGERAHRRFGDEGAAHDVATRRIGECSEDPIDVGIGELGMYNHLIVR